jgi:hypothetical protein
VGLAVCCGPTRGMVAAGLATWMAGECWTHPRADATLGADLADRRDYTLCRFSECPPSGTTRLGTVSSAHDNNRDVSGQVAIAVQWQIRPWMNLESTLGADSTNLESEGSNAGGSQLPPGAQSVNSTAVQLRARSAL